MSVSAARKARGQSPRRFSGRSRRPPVKTAPHSVKGLAFYDVDGTLVDLNLLDAALFLLANLGEWSGRLKYLLGLLARLPRLYAAEQRDRRLLNTVLFEAFKGVSRDRLEMLGEEYCERVLLPHLYPRAREIVEGNRAAGLEAVLVTGSPDFIIAPLANQLNIRAFAANRLVFSKGLATGRLHEPIMAGEDKAEWCESYAASRGLGLDSCWGYADSYYDLPFLAAVGHAVAVNPDRRLAAVARSRQWPITSFATPETTRSRVGLDWQGWREERKLNGAAGS
jgi:HAD superfamily hydrolase (TIGR01490 family)